MVKIHFHGALSPLFTGCNDHQLSQTIITAYHISHHVTAESKRQCNGEKRNVSDQESAYVTSIPFSHPWNDCIFTYMENHKIQPIVGKFCHTWMVWELGDD